jgi:glycerol-3-phosphate dehydrogenase (NAD(P)+)
MMRVAILGAGNWGTTLAIMLSGRAKVSLWAVEGIEGRENKKFLPGHEIPQGVQITDSLEQSVQDADVLLFALPSQVLRQVAGNVSVPRDAVIVSVTKGIENHSLKRMTEVLGEETGVSRKRLSVLSGPTIAREVVKELPTSCVSASEDESTAVVVQRLFNSPKFRVYTSTDVVGVELGGSLKNVLALAGGIVDGLGLGANAKGALLTRGISEMTRLGARMGADLRTFAGLSGIGDLITTAFSQHSRNRWVGEQIGRGRTLKDILSDMVEVAEGVSTAMSALELSKRYDVALPISQEIYEILFNGKPLEAGVKALMTRELKQEGV